MGVTNLDSSDAGKDGMRSEDEGCKGGAKAVAGRVRVRVEMYI